jgi:hypothetical protein
MREKPPIESEEEHPPTEEMVDMKDTVPQRVDPKGTKVEEIAGTGKHDSSGG